MTLRSAEELYADHSFHHSSAGGRRADVLRLVEKAQRNALEAAAKAMCWACDEGIPLDQRNKNAQAATVHVADARGFRVRCNAQPIHKLIPTDPAPAGNERMKGGGR